MRLILSRKGYDSASGGCASPIFPDGSLCSLPIPSGDELRLDDIRRGDGCLGDLVAQLADASAASSAHVHLDPDLDRGARPRPFGWRPCLGQTGAAQTHLERHGVDAGDLFLFFGWFREVSLDGGRWRHRPDAPDLHCLFGWLQVGAICRLDLGDPAPAWAAEHPHVRHADRYGRAGAHNGLYVAAERLSFPGCPGGVSGGGAFRRFVPSLRLTAPGRSRSVWRLPACFAPRSGAKPLSYHADPGRWERDGEGVLLRTVGRGQEFVLDCDAHPGVMDWLLEVFGPATAP